MSSANFPKCKGESKVEQEFKTLRAEARCRCMGRMGR